MGTTARKRPGDRITTEKRGHVGPRIRSGVIAEVLGAPEHEHYLVRWDDGKTSVYYPAQGEESATAPARAPAASRPAPAPMPKPTRAPERHLTAEPGDRLVVHGHHLGEAERDAEILEARGVDGGAPFFVRWADTGQETLVYPGSDAAVEHIVTDPTQRQSR